MFDSIIPVGQTCNITFLLQNTKIKTHTTLFEWFISPTLRAITDILYKIASSTDTDIITQRGKDIYMGNAIFSEHYKFDEFKIIYERRRNRLIDTIKSSKKIIFCRFEPYINYYTKEDIDDFFSAIAAINPGLEDSKLLFITPGITVEHPSLVQIKYDKHPSDPGCHSQEIKDLFLAGLQAIGYNILNTNDNSFTDMSIL